MWLIKQCIDHWEASGRRIDLSALIAAADALDIQPLLIDVDVPSLMLAGDMPDRINRELESRGIEAIPDVAGNEPLFARLIFTSLARRYAEVLHNLESLTDRHFGQITILGGGSRNHLLRRLTEGATGLTTVVGEAEGSTLGNFAVQLAALDAGATPSPELVRAWAERMTAAE
jgi:rhamnulokinase